MARHTIVFDNETTQKFATNARRGSDYKATIQNLSGEQIAITVTNEDIHSINPTFDLPASGALFIVNASISLLNEPYDGWLLTADNPTTGTVLIMESG